MILIVGVSSSYLDTDKNDILKVGESLLSPLGYYKITLLANCSLQILSFNNVTNKYELESELSENMS
jgi:hypothetical protein